MKGVTKNHHHTAVCLNSTERLTIFQKGCFFTAWKLIVTVSVTTVNQIFQQTDKIRD